MSDLWEQVDLEVDDKKVVHVIPVGDAMEHEYDEGCICGPEVRKAATGTVGVMHWPLDGRT